MNAPDWKFHFSSALKKDKCRATVPFIFWVHTMSNTCIEVSSNKYWFTSYCTPSYFFIKVAVETLALVSYITTNTHIFTCVTGCIVVIGKCGLEQTFFFSVQQKAINKRKIGNKRKLKVSWVHFIDGLINNLELRRNGQWTELKNTCEDPFNKKSKSGVYYLCKRQKKADGISVWLKFLKNRSQTNN